MATLMHRSARFHVLAALMVLSLFSARHAAAQTVYFGFNYSDGTNAAVGVVWAVNSGNGTYIATSGTMTVTSGADVGTYTLLPDPSAPTVVSTSDRAFLYDDLLYPGQTPSLDVDGLLFVGNGLEINIWGNVGAPYTFESFNGSESYGGSPVGNFALTQFQTYTITNLGTLGGSSSMANGINNAGQVVGSSTTANGDSSAFLWQNGVMTDLGGFGHYANTANGINNAGQVVGGLTTANGDTYPFLWQDGVVTDLGTLSGSFGISNGINNAGQVVGEEGAYNFSPDLWQNGIITNIGMSLGGNNSSVATAINNAGQVVGYSTRDIGFGLLTYAFLWQNGTVTLLSRPIALAFVVPTALNDVGQIVGCSSSYPSGANNYNPAADAVLWQNGVMTDLDTLGVYYYSSAEGINIAGQVVGFSRTNNGYQIGFLCQNGVMTDLDTLGVYYYSSAEGINIAGQVVGFSRTNNGYQIGFLCQSGVMADLNSLIPENSGWQLETTSGINDAGQIVGYGTFNGQTRAFLLTPNTPQAPVVITSVNASNFSLTGATLSWNTNLPANSIVQYGTSSAYGSVASSAALATAHTIQLTGLSPLTIYHYRVESTSAAGQTAMSADATFVTNNRSQFYTSYANQRTDASGNYLVDITFTNQGGSSIPIVNISTVGLGGIAPTSPLVPLVLNNLGAGASQTVTFTFPSIVGAAGARAVLLSSGWEGVTYGSPGSSLFNFSYRVVLP